jgi:hypothetical protein
MFICYLFMPWAFSFPIVAMDRGSVELNWADFEAKIQEATSLLECSIDPPEIINATSTACAPLALGLPFDRYTEVHSMCLSYFQSLKKHFSNRTKFPPASLQVAFLAALAEQRVVSRLYLALAVACASGNANHLKTVVSMLPAVAHPLRAFLLRYTAISLFPTDSQNYVSFTISNLEEMLALLPKFVQSYPDALLTGCGWLTANVSISLMSHSLGELIGRFLDCAKSCQIERTRVAIVECVIDSIDRKNIEEFFPLLRDYFIGTGSGELTKNLALRCCRICDKPALVFDFIASMPFRQSCGIVVTEIAIGHTDIETLRQCAELWPSEEVYGLILKALGPNEFADVVKELEPGMAVTCDFVIAATPETKPEHVRKILKNEMRERTEELDQLLCDLVARLRPDRTYIEIVFDAPFSFTGEKLIQYVIAAAARVRMPPEKILGFLNRTTNFNLLPILLLSHFDRRKGDELIDRLIENRSPLVRKLLISHLCEFDVTEQKLEALFATCRAPSELYDFCLLAGTKRFKGLLHKAILAYLKSDAKPSIGDQCDVYFNAINLMAGVCENEDIFEEGFVLLFLAHVKSVLQLVGDLPFPVWTSAQKRHYRTFLHAMQRAPGLAAATARIGELLDFFG